MPDELSLKEYFERIFDEREKALNLAFRSQQDALGIATTALNRELEHLNKLRVECVTKEEFTRAIDAIKSDIHRLEQAQGRQEGKSISVTDGRALLFSVIAVALSVALIIVQFVHH
jgi:hypothetical protein